MITNNTIKPSQKLPIMTKHTPTENSQVVTTEKDLLPGALCSQNACSEAEDIRGSGSPSVLWNGTSKA